MEIVVVGSINMDIMNRVDRHPVPGETVKGGGTSYSPGGKGANQAVAAAKSGAAVAMLGAVGTDPFGQTLTAALREYGVQTEALKVKEGSSGLAFITVDALGENTIILSDGSNGKLTTDDVAAYLPMWEGVKAILLQNEIPWEVNRLVMEQAKKRGIKVYFNPAPAMKIPAEAFRCIDVLILNETEAAAVTGLAAVEFEAAARKLVADGVGSVIVTLGEHGCYYADATGAALSVPAFKVRAVDTTAAGDTFIGAFARACLKGHSMEDNLRFASAASALTVTRPGAQSSIPDEQEVLVFLRKQP